jgi:hypothetical protein
MGCEKREQLAESGVADAWIQGKLFKHAFIVM